MAGKKKLLIRTSVQGESLGEFKSVLGSIAKHSCALNNPDLRFDPRCFDWYVGSKEQSLNQMEEPLYISPPEAQLHASSVLEVQLAQPLIDTRTDEVIGISMARLQGQQLLVALSEEMTPLGVGSFRVMTAAGDRARELDVLVAPGFTFGDDPVSTSEILLPNDSCDKFDASSSCRNVLDFSQIVEDMHAGGTDLQTFTRTSNTTGAPEMVSLTYAPVSVQSYRPIDPSDFSRGVRGYTSNVFSVALGSTEEGIALTFLSAQEALNGTLRRFVMSLLIILVVSLVVLVPVSAWISMSIAVPVTQLCQLVTHVNRYVTYHSAAGPSWCPSIDYDFSPLHLDHFEFIDPKCGPNFQRSREVRVRWRSCAQPLSDSTNSFGRQTWHSSWVTLTPHTQLCVIPWFSSPS